jgi:hypothetical protein
MRSLSLTAVSTELYFLVLFLKVSLKGSRDFILLVHYFLRVRMFFDIILVVKPCVMLYCLQIQEGDEKKFPL